MKYLSAIADNEKFMYNGQRYQLKSSIRSGGGRIGVLNLSTGKDTYLPATTQVEPDVEPLKVEPKEVVVKSDFLGGEVRHSPQLSSIYSGLGIEEPTEEKDEQNEQDETSGGEQEGDSEDSSPY